MLLNQTKKVVHNTEKQYIRYIICHNKTSITHSLRTNFDKFLDLTKLVLNEKNCEIAEGYFAIYTISVRYSSLGVL